MVAAYSLFSYIQAGPHMTEDGRLDLRTWFYIPVELDEAAGSITYLKFPAGAVDHEIVEEVVDLSPGLPWID